MESKCELCGHPMPPGEEMFAYHGYSGPCPEPPILMQEKPARIELPTYWRKKASESREEAQRIRSTVKDSTDAEERSNVRAEIWEQCASELESSINES